MNKLNSFIDSYFEENQSNEEDQRENESNDQLEKVLCEHCGRTASNGIRCLGFCVADNDY